MSLQLAAALLLSQTGTLAHLYCSWMFKGELHATNAGSGPHNSRSVSISNATSRKRAEECTGEEYWSKQCPENTFTAIHQVKPARSAEPGSFLHTNTRATRPSTDGYRDPRAVHRSSSGNFFSFFLRGKNAQPVDRNTGVPAGPARSIMSAFRVPHLTTSDPTDHRRWNT